MKYRIALSALICVAAAGCVAQAPYDASANNRTYVATTTVTTPSPIAPVPPAPVLSLMNSGSVVGYRVFDAGGQPIGYVQAVAVVRGTGEVRNLIVSSPNFGLGNYISVPAINAQTVGDRVVLNAPTVVWMQAPRYQTPQLSEMYVAY